MAAHSEGVQPPPQVAASTHAGYCQLDGLRQLSRHVSSGGARRARDPPPGPPLPAPKGPPSPRQPQSPSAGSGRCRTRASAQSFICPLGTSC